MNSSTPIANFYHNACLGNATECGPMEIVPSGNQCQKCAENQILNKNLTKCLNSSEDCENGTIVSLAKRKCLSCKENEFASEDHFTCYINASFCEGGYYGDASLHQCLPCSKSTDVTA